MKKYYFKEITYCDMCGEVTQNHKILGQRLNQSQGLNPKKKTGISISVKKCTNCDLIYSSPQPIPFDIQDHYGNPPEEYWKPAYFQWDSNYFSRQINIAKQLLLNDEKNKYKALDVGAGLGKAMLSMEASGFDTYGFEPSIPFRDRAIEKMGINPEKLKLGMVEEVEYEAEYFDFITFGAVFEHLYEPSNCLKKALMWLKPQGIIHIEVPSSNWLLPKIINTYFKLIGTSYVTNLSPMHEPFHLHEFGIKSFQKLSSKLNFTIEKNYVDVCSIYSIPKLLHPLLKRYMKATDTGMQLTVFLRKN